MADRSEFLAFPARLLDTSLPSTDRYGGGVMRRSVVHRSSWCAVVLCTTLTGAVGGSGADAAPPPTRHDVRGTSHAPGLFGDRAKAHGRAAVQELGDRLPETAQRNGMAAERLRKLLLEDQTAWLDDGGRLFYQEPAAAAGTTTATPEAEAAAPAPISDTFLLHSKLGSKHTIFLDFNGHDVSNTVWTETYGVRAGFHAGWSLDADAAFNTTE